MCLHLQLYPFIDNSRHGSVFSLADTETPGRWRVFRDTMMEERPVAMETLATLHFWSPLMQTSQVTDFNMAPQIYVQKKDR